MNGIIMNAADIVNVLMWVVSGLLIPAFGLLFQRVRGLELKMETRISHQDAAKMIKDSVDAIDRRFDRLEEIIIEDFKRR